MGPDLQRLEELPRDLCPLETLWLGDIDQVDVPPVVRRHALDRPTLRLPIEKVGGRDAHPIDVSYGSGLDEAHEPVDAVEQKRTQQYRVDRAEHRKIGTDTETESEGDDQREAGVLEQTANGIAEIRQHGCEGPGVTRSRL